MRFIGWLLGFGGEGVTSISEVEPSLAAPWAQENSFWVLLGGAALLVTAFVFYLRFQPKGSLSRCACEKQRSTSVLPANDI